MNGATPAPRPSARGALAALLVPGGAVVLLAALLGTRVRVSWPGVLLAAALYSLAAWTTYRLGLALRRGRWKELLLGFASAAAALGLAEAALRVLRPYESLCRFRWIASARYHHMNPPRRRMFSGYVEGAPIVVETNEDGLRTHHSRQSFRAQAVRVAVLGDSFVFGSGVNAQEAFPARLERRLQAHALPGGAAVLNAGIISFSPFLERRLFDDVVREYRPTVVLLFLDVTDIGDDAIYARKAGGQGTFPLEGEAALGCHGAVYQLAQPALEGLGGSLLYPYHLLRARQGLAPPARASYYTDPVVFQGRPENRYFIYRYPLEQTRPYFAETLRNVEAVAASARAAGARFVLVV
ncbi:MAG TPA: hypothetical protein VFO85_06610, partial [Vicinamibacteria bacterium]|nr:hypothetical protein [Vicinamibacteria bacterium]